MLTPYLLIFILVFLDAVGINTFLGRAFLSTHSLASHFATDLIVLSLLFAFAIIITSLNSFKLRTNLNKLLFILQIPLPLLLFCLFPPPWQLGDKWVKGYEPSLELSIILLLSIAFAEQRLWRRYQIWKQHPAQSIWNLLEPACLMAILIFLKTPLLADIPILSTDDYHFGEKLLPWQQWQEFWKIPYVDMYPVHGLIEFLIGGINAHLFNGTPEALAPAKTVLDAFLIAVTFLTLCSLLNNTLLGFLIAGALPTALNIRFAGLTLTACALFILAQPRWIQQPLKWLSIWLSSSLVSCLFLFTSGVPFVLGSLPIAGWMFIKQIKTDIYALLKMILLIVFVVGLFGLLTPFLEMLQGLITYISENAEINTVAYATPWNWGQKLIPDLLRLSYLGVVVSAAYLGGWEMSKDPVKRSATVLVLAPSIALSLLFFTPYTLGRIDAPGFSRTQPSVHAMLILLPVLLFSCFPKQRNSIIVVVILLISLYDSRFDLLPSPQHFLIAPVAHAVVPADSRSQRPAPFKTHAILDDSQYRELTTLKKILHTWLRPGELFLDLTNRNALYYYLHYPVPMPNSAFYNMPATAMQYRALQKLQQNPPPLVLIGPALLLDGVPVSLRSYLIYRHFVLTYVPVEIDHFSFLIAPDRVESLKTSQSEQLDLLDKAFRVSDLQKLPSAWGASWYSLKNQCHKVTEIIPSLKKAISKDNGLHTISFDIEKLKLAGRDAGLLSFDFTCDSLDSLPMRLTWADVEIAPATLQFTAQNGHLVVPMDSFPRWLLANEIRTLEFNFSATCPAGSLKNIEFFQRNSVKLTTNN